MAQQATLKRGPKLEAATCAHVLDAEGDDGPDRDFIPPPKHVRMHVPAIYAGGASGHRSGR